MIQYSALKAVIIQRCSITDSTVMRPDSSFLLYTDNFIKDYCPIASEIIKQSEIRHQEQSAPASIGDSVTGGK